MQCRVIFSAVLIALVASGTVAVGSAEAIDWKFWNWRKQEVRENRKDVRKFLRQQQRSFDRLDNRWFGDRWQPQRSGWYGNGWW